MREPLTATLDGVLLLVRVTPRSSKNAVLGVATRGPETRLMVKVRAAPHDGEANDAVLDLIAKSLGVKQSSIRIAAGAKDRDKTILISGLRLDAVAAWLTGLGRHGETN